MSELDFVAELSGHVPDRRRHSVRYLGPAASSDEADDTSANVNTERDPGHDDDWPVDPPFAGD